MAHNISSRILKGALILATPMLFGSCKEKLTTWVVPEYKESTETVYFMPVDIDLGKMDLKGSCGTPPLYFEDRNDDYIVDKLTNICGENIAYDSTIKKAQHPWQNNNNKYAFGHEDFLKLQKKIDNALQVNYKTSFKEILNTFNKSNSRVLNRKAPGNRI